MQVQQLMHVITLLAVKESQMTGLSMTDMSDRYGVVLSQDVNYIFMQTNRNGATHSCNGLTNVRRATLMLDKHMILLH